MLNAARSGIFALVFCLPLTFTAETAVNATQIELAFKFSKEPKGQVVGSYGRGKLHRASSLRAEGPGYVEISYDEDRQHGALRMIDLLEQSAATIARLHPEGERLQIGDISNLAGGRLSGHLSHQNGLDADLIFYRRNHREQRSLENGAFGESFVENGRVTENFDLERNWMLMKLFVSSGRVNRIFLDQAIKKAYCEKARKSGQLGDKLTRETLHRLRHEPAHDDHLHLRLNCPKNSLKCRKQKPLPSGIDC